MSCPPEGVRDGGRETVRQQEGGGEVEEGSKGKRGPTVSTDMEKNIHIYNIDTWRWGFVSFV